MRSRDGSRGRPDLRLALLAGAQLLLILDGSIMNVALPAISESLDAAPSRLSWVVNAYTLAFAGLLLAGGRCADQLGARRTFVAGMALFTAASLLGATARSAGWLIAARTLQGLGAALLAPSILALMTVSYARGAERARALATWGAVSIAGAPVGGILGGLLAGSLGWEAVLLVNVPVGAAALLAANRLLPVDTPERGRRPGLADALTATGGTSLLVLALVTAGDAGWTSGLVLGCLAGSAALLAAFAWIERRAADPLIPGSLLRGPLKPLCATGALVGMQFVGAPFYLTFYFQHGVGLTPLATGSAFLPWGVAAILAARAVPAGIRRLGFRAVVATGFVMMAGGLTCFGLIGPRTAYVAGPLPGLVLHAAGLSLAGVALNVAVLSFASTRDAGAAGSVLTAVLQLGAVLGLAVAVAVFGAAGGAGAEAALAFDALHATFAVGAALALAGGVLALLVL